MPRALVADAASHEQHLGRCAGQLKRSSIVGAQSEEYEYRGELCRPVGKHTSLFILLRGKEVEDLLERSLGHAVLLKLNLGLHVALHVLEDLQPNTSQQETVDAVDSTHRLYRPHNLLGNLCVCV